MLKPALKTLNAPALLIVWLLNVAAFYCVVSDLTLAEAARLSWEVASELAASTAAVWASGILLLVVVILNGLIPRPRKEVLVFWPAPSPGARAFSHFMFKDSTINRKVLQKHFSPLPSEPDEQNALWAKWLNEFEDDARVRPCYQLYLFARDWTTATVILFVAGAPSALCLSEGTKVAFWYTAGLLGQGLLARWLARVQGEQLTMSVVACKASSLPERRGDSKNGSEA